MLFSGASYQFKLAYVRSLPSSEVESAALDVIATALRQQNVFDFDPIYRLEAVTSVKDSELYSLLHIFLNDGLSEYKAWIGSHKEILAKNGQFPFPHLTKATDFISAYQIWTRRSLSVRSVCSA